MHPWIWVIVLLTLVVLLAVKIIGMKKSLGEIRTLFREHLSTDTNALITVSSKDRQICRLAAEINTELRALQKQRRRYLNGDRELKEAVTNISHDLRTPITAISGYLELLAQEKKSETVGKYLAYIENRTDALKSLTEELFRYTVILSTETLVSEPVDVKAVLEESLLGFYGALTERGIQTKLQIAERQVVRSLNRSALSRVFGNILNNVLKYSDGDLSVELRENGEIIFGNTAHDLDEVQVKKLFNRFYTVEAARNSTGLGLSIARTLTEQMDGEIFAEYEDHFLRIVLRL